MKAGLAVLVALPALALSPMSPSQAQAPSTVAPLLADCVQKLANITDVAGIYPAKNGLFLFGYELQREPAWYPKDPAGQTALADDFARLAAALKARGTTLVAVPVPLRSAVFAAALDRTEPVQAAFDAAKAASLYSGFVATLRSRGVLVADVQAAFGEAAAAGGLASPMSRTDHHWTLAGSRLAAQQVAALVTRDVGYAALPKTDYRTRQVGELSTPRLIATRVQELCGISLPPEPFQRFETRKLAADELDADTLNFSAVEPGPQRWSFGPSSAVTVQARRAGPMEVRFSFANQIANQEVEVRWNERVIERIGPLPAFSRLERTYRVDAVAGTNTLGFAYSDWNHNKTTFAGEDGRLLALYFSRLEFESAGPPVQRADLIRAQAPEGALFGDEAAPVVLVGSSYSQPDLNFEGFLESSLSLNVLNTAMGAGGSYSSIKDYLLSKAYLASPPEYLVWEFPTLDPNDYREQFRHLVPSVGGDCGKGALDASFSRGPGPYSLLNVAGLPLTGPSSFVSVKVADERATGVDFTVAYTDGTRESVRLNHHARMANRDRFFLEFAVGKRLDRIEFVLYRGDEPLTDAEGAVEARVCTLKS